MKNKAFKLGIIVGRFQTFHTGHLDMIEKACAVCDRVGIFVGSSQESGTLKNPFTYETRRKMLQKVCGSRVTVYPLRARYFSMHPAATSDCMSGLSFPLLTWKSSAISSWLSRTRFPCGVSVCK